MLKKYLKTATKIKSGNSNEDVDLKPKYSSRKATEIPIPINKIKRKDKTLFHVDKLSEKLKKEFSVKSDDEIELKSYTYQDLSANASNKKIVRRKRQTLPVISPTLNKPDCYQHFISQLNKILLEESKSKSNTEVVVHNKQRTTNVKNNLNSPPLIDILSVKENRSNKTINAKSRTAISSIQAKIEEINNYIKRRSYRHGIFKTQRDINHTELNDADNDQAGGSQMERVPKTAEAKLNSDKKIMSPYKKATIKGIDDSQSKSDNSISEKSKHAKKKERNSLKNLQQLKFCCKNDFDTLGHQFETLANGNERNNVKPEQRNFKKTLSNHKLAQGQDYEICIPFEDDKEMRSSDASMKIPQTCNVIASCSFDSPSSQVEGNFLEEKIENYVQKCRTFDEKTIKKLIDKIETIESFVYTTLGNTQRTSFDDLFYTDELERSQAQKTGQTKEVIVKYQSKSINSCPLPKISKFCDESIVENLQNEILALESFFPTATVDDDDEFTDAHSFTSIHDHNSNTKRGEKCLTYHRSQDSHRSPNSSQEFYDTTSKTRNDDYGTFMESNSNGKLENCNFILTDTTASYSNRNEGISVRNNALKDAKKILNEVEHLFHMTPVYRVKSSNALNGYQKHNVKSFHKSDSFNRKAIEEFRKTDQVPDLVMKDSSIINVQPKLRLEKCRLKITEIADSTTKSIPPKFHMKMEEGKLKRKEEELPTIKRIVPPKLSMEKCKLKIQAIEDPSTEPIVQSRFPTQISTLNRIMQPNSSLQECKFERKEMEGPSVKRIMQTNSSLQECKFKREEMEVPAVKRLIQPKFSLEECKLKTKGIEVSSTNNNKTYASISTNTTSTKEIQCFEVSPDDSLKNVNSVETTSSFEFTGDAIKRLQRKMNMFEKSNCLANLRSKIAEIKSSYTMSNNSQQLETLNLDSTSIGKESIDLLNNDDDALSSYITISQCDTCSNSDTCKTLENIALKITENTNNFEKEIQKCKIVFNSLKKGSRPNLSTKKEESTNNIICRPQSEHKPRNKISKNKGYFYKRKSIFSSKVHQITRVIRNIQNKINQHEKLCLSCNQQALSLIHQKINSLKEIPGCSSATLNSLHDLLNNSNIDTSYIAEKANSRIIATLQSKLESMENILNCDFSTIQSKVNMFNSVCSGDHTIIKKLQDKIEKLESALNIRSTKISSQHKISNSTLCTSPSSTVSMFMPLIRAPHFSNSDCVFDDIPPCTYFIAGLGTNRRRPSSTDWNYYESFNNSNYDSELQDQRTIYF